MRSAPQRTAGGEREAPELVSIFKAGQWGQSVLSGIQVLPVQDGDGCTLLDGGFSSVAALKQIRDEHATAETVPDDPALKKIFSDGMENVPCGRIPRQRRQGPPARVECR